MRNFALILVFAWGIALADADGPCGQDGPKICPKEKFGQGKMFECLSKNLEKLSAKCKRHVEELTAYKKDCAPEIEKYCKGQTSLCLFKLPKDKVEASAACKPYLE